MKTFGGPVLFLDRSDINTDEIIPAKYLTEITKEDLKPYILEDLKLPGFDPNGPMDDGNPMGTPEAELTTRVDVAAYLDRKREALRAHRSQITDVSFFETMPDEAFAQAFGTEWYIRVGAPAGVHEDWLFG